MRRTIRVDGDGTSSVACIRCRIRITFADNHGPVVADLLASHWADDHHLSVWRDAAAEARDRLWRHHPELLEQLTNMSDNIGHRRLTSGGKR
jgi:hypothetical protein